MLLVGTLAGAAMLPQFAIFIPIVAAAWILARLGLLRRVVGHHHAGVRLSPGPDVHLTTLRAVLEAESRRGPDEKQLLQRLVTQAQDVAGASSPAATPDCLIWRAGPPREATASDHLRLDDWPELREALVSGAGLALSTRSSVTRGVRRIEAMVVGERPLIERLALAHATALRCDGVEVVTTGWLRHAERLRTKSRARKGVGTL